MGYTHCLGRKCKIVHFGLNTETSQRKCDQIWQKIATFAKNKVLGNC